MGVDYGLEKFFNSIHFAVASTQPLQERLSSVISGVCHLRRESFPNDETFARFERLITGTTMLPAKDKEGTIASTTSQMEESEARQWLHEAFGIFAEIADVKFKLGKSS
jgi:hypothetical protein